MPLLWELKSCFFFAPKRFLSQGKPSKKNLCTTTRRELSESPSYALKLWQYGNCITIMIFFSDKEWS